MIIQSLFPIPSRDTYINPLPIITMFHGGNARLVYDVFRVASRYSPFLLQLEDISSGPPHFSYLIHLVTSCCGCLRYYTYFLQKSKFTVFLLKNFLNGLSLLKFLFRRFRKYLPMLMLVSLQNGGLNQIILLFLFFPCLFEWSFLVSPTLTSWWVLLLLLLHPLEPEFTGFTYSSLPWNPLFLRD